MQRKERGCGNLVLNWLVCRRWRPRITDLLNDASAYELEKNDPYSMCTWFDVVVSHEMRSD